MVKIVESVVDMVFEVRTEFLESLCLKFFVSLTKVLDFIACRGKPSVS